MVITLFSILLCGIFLVWFLHVWICHIWIFRVWIFPIWRDEKQTMCALSGIFLCRNIGIWHRVQNPLTAKERLKIDLYLDSKSSCLPIIYSKGNRLFHRPISSVIGTGGLDFLIGNALLTMCHSLFEVVIQILWP